MYYLDTSVLTAHYWPEPRSTLVDELLSALEGQTISPLVEVEFHCTVARKVRADGLDPAAARRLFAKFQADLTNRRFVLTPIGPAEYQVARDWIASLSIPLRVLDALHLACASTGGLELVTADKQLARAAKHVGVRCRLVS
jgi:predicted nucleic acid-binding protein